ncbi:MAG: DUF2141 domain-containing protein [Candidatus Kapabacteria bacterium]|nr:DUF2141 domain-containing protein [Ignavibacteriota bacterium]MCW5884745.1 DUF2141 domain-containing protein [Candidatus Kapabacteria bacterium]
MRIEYIFALLLLFFSPLIGDDNESPKKNKSSNLNIVVSGIKSDSGFVRVHLYNSERKDFFPKKTLQCYKRQVIEIKDGICRLSFNDLPYDTYCFSVHHDENANEKMDTNILGLPTEGWGISNNVKLFMRLPNFDECSFILDNNDITINVEMRY